MTGFAAEGPTKLESNCQLDWAFTWIFLGRIFFQVYSWQNPLPYGCGNGVPIFLLNIGQRSLSDPRGNLARPCIFKSSVACQILFPIWNLSNCPSAPPMNSSANNFTATSLVLLPEHTFSFCNMDSLRISQIFKFCFPHLSLSSCILLYAVRRN